jgi:O-acetylhomoserine (thiol)-lyase
VALHTHVKGLESLQQQEGNRPRSRDAVSNARQVAEYLKNHEAVTWVNYPGFPESPYYEL